jgi:hypothetical protein
VLDLVFAALAVAFFVAAALYVRGCAAIVRDASQHDTARR